MAEHNSNDPATLEREVERTQDAIGETVDKIEEKLSPTEVSRSLLGDDGSEVAKDALEVVKSNPIPVAMIAVGFIWLLATSDSRSVKRLRDRVLGSGEKLIPRSQEPAPIGPGPNQGGQYDRRR